MPRVLQGRALLNAIGNLELTGGYADALTKLGHSLESVARQVSLHFFFSLFNFLSDLIVHKYFEVKSCKEPYNIVN